MALVMKRRLIIADEPTTALDVMTQKQILKLLKELQHAQGTDVPYIRPSSRAARIGAT